MRSARYLVQADNSCHPKLFFWLRACIGQRTKPKDNDDDSEITYLRRKKSTEEFNLQVEDIASVKL